MNCHVPITSNEYFDFILEYYFYVQHYLNDPQVTCSNTVNNQYAILHVPSSIVPVFSLDYVSYNSIPKLYSLLDTTSMEASGILPVLNQPFLNARGQNIIIGFIDTGIDYRSPAFRNANGSTRIAGIWDQTISSPEETNSSFAVDSYGTEYTEEQINEALASDDPFSIVPSRDESGHGTFLAGIAAGSDLPGQDFIGAAPESSIVMVKMKQAKEYLKEFFLISPDAAAYQETDIMMGIKYLLYMANKLSQPLVICIGLGTNSGGHDGSSSLSQLLNSVSNNMGIVTVVAGGNEAGFGHHYFGVIPVNVPYEDVELRVDSEGKSFSLELWARQPEIYSIGFVSPTGEAIERIPNVPLNSDHRITFILEKTVITVHYQISVASSGSQLIFMRFEDPTPGIWRLRVYSSLFINGEYHMWLPVSNFVSPDTYFLRPNPDTTITDPGNAIMPITVAAYNHRDNSLYIHSSRGYTRVNGIKPDIAAPGVNVTGPARAPGGASTPPQSLSTTTQTGTSVAAAHTAGAAALLMSWGFTENNFPGINTSVAKAYLIRGADRNPAYAYPNKEWGFGTLNLYNSFIQLRQ